MARCDYNNEKGAVEEVYKITKDIIAAQKIIRANNGYSIRYDKNGFPSELFKDLVRITGNEETALKLKLGLYTELNVDEEPNVYDFLRRLVKNVSKPRKKNYVLNDQINVKDLNSKSAIRNAIVSHAIDRAISHFKEVSKKEGINLYPSGNKSLGTIWVIDDNSTSRYKKLRRITAFINGLFGNTTIATYKYGNDFVKIEPTQEMIDAIQRKVIRDKAEKEYPEYEMAQNYQRQAEKEGNYYIKDGEIIPIYDRLPSDKSLGISQDLHRALSRNMVTALVFQRNNLNATINALRLKARTSKNYSKYISRLLELTKIRDEISKRISQLSNIKGGGVSEIIINTIENNFEYAERLTKTGNPDDLYKALQIYETFSKVADFNYIGKNTNPLISDKFIKTFANLIDIDEKITDLKINLRNAEADGDITLAKNISNEITRIEDLNYIKTELINKANKANKKYQELRSKTIDMAVNTINSMPGTITLYGRKLTVNDILSPKKDIDWLSRKILGIGRTFDFGGEESVLATAIYKIVSDAIIEKNAEMVSFSKKFDTIERKIKEELKKNNHTYKDVFFKKDKFGITKFKLIDKFNDKWYSKIAKLNSERQKNIYSINGKRGNFNRTLAIKMIHVNHFKKLNPALIDDATNKNTVIIDPLSLPEIVSEFHDHPLVIKYLGKPYEELDKTRTKLIQKYGKIKYDEIVERQSEKIKEYLEKVRSLVTQAAIDYEIEDFDYKTRAEFENLLNRIPSSALINEIASENPFIVRNFVDKNINEKERQNKLLSISPKLSYNIILPFNDSMFDKNFQTIESNSIYTEFYKLAKDGIRYINDVLSDTDLQLTGMSTMMISKGVIKTFATKDIPFGYKIRNFIRAERDYFITYLTGKKFVANTTDTPTEISKGGFNSPDKWINERYKKVMSYFKSIGEISKEPKLISEFSKEVIKTLTNIAEIPNNEGTLENYLNIKRKLTLSEIVTETLRKRVEDEGNFDLGKILKLYVRLASAYDGRRDIISTIDILRNVYKEIPKYTKEESQERKIFNLLNSSKTDEERTNAIKKIDSYFTRVVRNYHGVRPIKIYKSLKLYTSAEKERLRQIKTEAAKLIREQKNTIPDSDRWLEIETKLEELNKERESIGNNIDLSSLFYMISGFIVFKGLTFNPKVAFNNFSMGQFTNVVLDHLGLHWTPGNYAYVTNFLRRRMFNIKNRVLKNIFEENEKDYNSIRIAEILFTRSLIFDDVRNELQKADKYVGKETLKNKLHPFYLAITGPEWYNQAGAALAVLMDIKIKDSFGNEHPAFTKDGHFTMYDETVEGLKLKPEFKYKFDENGNQTSELSEEGKKNVRDWEELKGEKFKDYRLRAKDAIKDGQGDFSQLSGLEIKDSSLGRLAMTLHTWIGQFLWLTFGKEENIITGKKRGMLPKHLTASPLAVTIGALTGVAFGPYTSIIAAVSAFAASKVFVNNIDRELISYKNDVRELVGYIGTIAESFGALLINYTMGKRIVKVDSQKLMGFKPNVNDPELEPSSEAIRAIEEHAQAINTLSIMLASSLTIMSMIVGLKKLVHCPEYASDTIKCKRLKNIENFISNILSGIYNDMTLTINPYSLYQLTKLKILDSTLDRVLNLTLSIEQYFGDEDITTSGENSGKSTTVTRSWKLLPGPTSMIDDVTKIMYPRRGTIKEFNRNYVTEMQSNTDKLKKLINEVRSLRRRQLYNKYGLYDNIPRDIYNIKKKQVEQLLNNEIPTYTKIRNAALKHQSFNEWEEKGSKKAIKVMTEKLHELKKNKR